MDPDHKLLEREPPRSRAGNLVIRAMRMSDAEGIAALANLPGYRFGTLRLPYQGLEETKRFIENLSPSHVGLVALTGDQVVGSAGLERFSGRRNHVGSLGMGVHDDFVGQGIGTMLLRAILDTADSWLNLKRLELTVYVDNAPAIDLYKRHGFEVEGTLRQYAFREGRFTHAFAMARLRSEDA